MITEMRWCRTPVISHAIRHSSAISTSHVHVPWATLVHSIIAHGVPSAHITRSAPSYVKRMRHISRASSHVTRMGHVAWAWTSSHVTKRTPSHITRRMRHVARAWWSSPDITRMRHISWTSSHHVTPWRRHISRRNRSSHVTTRRRHIPV